MRESDLMRSDPDYDPFHNGADEAVIVVRADGRVLARIPNAARPAWSPDGRQLAFDSDRGGRRQIYVADANGQNVRQLTHGPRASWRALAPPRLTGRKGVGEADRSGVRFKGFVKTASARGPVWYHFAP